MLELTPRVFIGSLADCAEVKQERVRLADTPDGPNAGWAEKWPGVYQPGLGIVTFLTERWGEL